MPGKKTSKIILGIDPGYDRMGWAIGFLERGAWTKLAYGCIQTDSKDSLFKRYQEIDVRLQKIIDKFEPSVLAIESLFFFKNKKTALKVSEVRGVILSACFRNGMEIFEYTPIQIKQAVTGHGQASKDGVEKLVRMQLGLPAVDKSGAKNKIIDDAIDALAVLMTYQARVKMDGM